MRQYASTLLYLSLKIYSKPLAVNFAPLSLLTSLTTLEVDSYCTRSRVFWASVVTLQSIRIVKTTAAGQMPETMRETIPMLGSLQELEARKMMLLTAGRNVTFLPSDLVHLTGLALFIRDTSLQLLSSLTQLEDLHLNIVLDYFCKLDNVLRRTTRLQRLCITVRSSRMRTIYKRFGKTAELSGIALAGMRNLKSLALESVDVDGAFFRTLAANVNLTNLEFADTRTMEYFHLFLAQINLLKDLKELTLRIPHKCDVFSVLSRTHLSNLTKLDTNATSDELRRLRRKFWFASN